MKSSNYRSPLPAVIRKAAQTAVFFLLLLCCSRSFAQTSVKEDPFPKTEYSAANTAENESYLTAEEKEVFYYVNLARMYPKLFAEKLLDQYTGRFFNKSSSYVQSLRTRLMTMKALPAVKPDKKLFDGAYCFASQSGAKGIVGHERTNTSCKSDFFGECCSYGHNKGLDIVIQLLVDEGVSSLGHREICLGGYSYLGVSIQPHKEYRYTAVLDFK